MTGSFNNIGSVDSQLWQYWQPLAVVTMTTVIAMDSSKDCGPQMEENISIVFKTFGKKYISFKCYFIMLSGYVTVDQTMTKFRISIAKMSEMSKFFFSLMTYLVLKWSSVETESECGCKQK